MSVTVVVSYRGRVFEVACSPGERLPSLAHRLASLTGAEPATLKLLVSGRAVLLEADADAGVESLLAPRAPQPPSVQADGGDATAPARTPRLLLLCTSAADVATVAAAPAAAAARAAAAREPPAEHEAAVEARRSSAAPPQPARLPAGPHTFLSFRVLQRRTELDAAAPSALLSLDAGGDNAAGPHDDAARPLTPPSAAALALLHRLACDPGISAVMAARRYSVALLSEMPPEGKVGISAVCVLGVNVNKGQEISLRLRTDDWRGLRQYERVRETLIHELAHMEVSPHDDAFKRLNAELTRTAAAADWTRGAARRLGLLAAAPPRPRPQPAAAGAAEGPAGGGRTLGRGGAESGLLRAPREAAAAAAAARRAAADAEAEMQAAAAEAEA